MTMSEPHLKFTKCPYHNPKSFHALLALTVRVIHLNNSA